MRPPTLTADTVELIRSARRRIEPIERWTAGEFALDANGLRVSEEDLPNTLACECACWCAVGAVITEHRLACARGKTPDLHLAIQALAYAARQILPTLDPDALPGQRVAELNDRDHNPLTGALECAHDRRARVLSMFDRALANPA